MQGIFTSMKSPNLYDGHATVYTAKGPQVVRIIYTVVVIKRTLVTLVYEEKLSRTWGTRVHEDNFLHKSDY